MKNLDDLLSTSMTAVAVRNDHVFESTRIHMHSVIKGGSLLWPWTTALGAVAAVGISWYAYNVATPEPVRVVSKIQTDRTVTTSPEPKQPPSFTAPIEKSTTNLQTSTQPSSVKATVSLDEMAFQDLFNAHMVVASNASLKGDHLLAANTYRDLVRTCMLNKKFDMAKQAVDHAVAESHLVGSESFRVEIAELKQQVESRLGK